MSHEPIVSHGRGGNYSPLSLCLSKSINAFDLRTVERLLTDGIYLSRHGQYQSRSHIVRFSSADFLLHVVAADNGDRYVDGEIVRQGPVGDQGDGAYSAGVCPPLLIYIHFPVIYKDGDDVLTFSALFLSVVVPAISALRTCFRPPSAKPMTSKSFPTQQSASRLTVITTLA